MMEEVGSYPHNMSNSSPVIWGDLIFVSTSNGQDESHVHIPSPKAPAIIALNKNTGKLVWEDNSVEDRILHGQWSTPSVGKIGGVDQVVSAQGDGWVRGYEAATGKKLWEFDTNPKDSVWPKTRNEVIAHAGHLRGPRLHRQRPGSGARRRRRPLLRASTRPSAATSPRRGRVWHFDKIRRSISTASIADGLLYIPDFSGFLHCLDAKTGQEYWTHDMLAAVWGSPLVVDGKVYLGDEDGDVVVLQAGKEKKVLAEMNMGSAVYATPVPAHGALFLNNRNQLFALAANAASRRRSRAGITRPRSTRSKPAERLSSCLRVFVAHGSRGAVAGADQRRRRRRRLAAVPRQPAADRRRRPARRRPTLTLHVDLRSRRRRSTRRRRSSTASVYVGVGNGRSARARSRRRASCAGSTRPARLDRRVVAGRRRRARSSSAICAGIVHAVRRARRQPALDVQDRRRDQVVARRRRRRRADRIVRHAPLRARRRDRQACAGSCRPTARCTRRPPCRTASSTSRGCDEQFRAIRLADGKVLFEIPLGAYTGAVAGRSTATAPTSARSTTRCSRIDLRARKIAWRYRESRSAVSRSIRRRRSANGRVIVGGRDKLVHAIDAATRQSRLDVRRRARASIRRRPSPAAACTSDRATASSTCSTLRPDRSSGSSTPAPPSRRRRPSPPAASWSARRTAGSTASDKIRRRRRFPHHMTNDPRTGASVRQLGSYALGALLGSGGMGECVSRARYQTRS